jgi:leucyl aminopeptidase
MIDVVAGPEIAAATGDALVLPVLADIVWGPGTAAVVAELGDGVEGFLRQADFTGKVRQTVALPGGPTGFERIVLVGLGDEIDAEALRRAAAEAARATIGAETVVTTLHQIEIDDAADLVAFGFATGLYRFEEFTTARPPLRTRRLVLAGGAEGEGSRGLTLAAAVAMARDLTNRPANHKAPQQIASWAAIELGDAGVDVEIWDEGRIAEERLGALLAVASGSAQTPRLVRAHHRPDDAVARLVFVGKGIVFDSGGLSIKPADGMVAMKTDMAGAAAVLCAVWAIARLEIPVEVIAITPLTENMVGAAAMRPGDVITARNGKTIEVLNTDAEGRLVLADGLVVAAEEQPDLVVDLATLTGACKVALGLKTAGLFASDDDVAATLESAARSAGEQLWRLPIEDEARTKLDSPVADLKNIGDRWGGAGTAALFLREFTDGVPWAHLDIAGPARVETAEHYLSIGASGFGVRTLVALAEQAARANGMAAAD